MPRVPPLEPLIEHLEHTRPSSAALEARWPRGASLPLKEGSGGAIPGSGKHRRQIASRESVYRSVSHVHNVPCLPMADIYYSEAGVYSGRPGLSGHLASFIVSVLPSGAALPAEPLSLVFGADCSS